MQLFTSYYAQLRNFPRNLIGLSTAVWPPKFLQFGVPDKRGVIVIDCPPFHPGEQCAGLCEGKCNPKHPDDCKFLEVYRTQLDEIDLEKLLTKLENLANKIKENEKLNDVDFAFLVYEAPRNICSERVVIQAWGAYCGLEIKEWNN